MYSLGNLDQGEAEGGAEGQAEGDHKIKKDGKAGLEGWTTC